MINNHIAHTALLAAIQARDWDTFDRLVGNSQAEAERYLREEPLIDASEINQLMEQLDAGDKNYNLSECNAVSIRQLTESLDGVKNGFVPPSHS